MKIMERRLESKILACNNEVYSSGRQIATILNLETRKVEDIVKSAARKSRQKIDWHYFGGSAVVKALGNLDELDKARSCLKSKLEEYGHQKYRLTTRGDLLLPYPIFN